MKATGALEDSVRSLFGLQVSDISPHCCGDTEAVAVGVPTPVRAAEAVPFARGWAAGEYPQAPTDSRIRTAPTPLQRDITSREGCRLLTQTGTGPWTASYGSSTSPLDVTSAQRSIATDRPAALRLVHHAGAARSSSRISSPYLRSFDSPTPDTRSSSVRLAGFADAMAASVESWNTT